MYFFLHFLFYNFIRYAQDNKLSNILRELYFYYCIIYISYRHYIYIITIYLLYFAKSVKRSCPNKNEKGYSILSYIISNHHTNCITIDIYGKVSFLKSSVALFNRLNFVNEFGINSNIGSAYLTSLGFNYFKDLILYTPLKVFYFLFSPMPWGYKRDSRHNSSNIRCNLFYIMYVPKAILSFKDTEGQTKKDLLLKTLIYSFVLVVGVYAMGTIASGTAIRT